MDILVNVINQKLTVAINNKTIVEGTQEFVRFVFNLSDDWDGLHPFAQFIQDGNAYNSYLNDDNAVYLPSEIKAGTCNMLLFGSAGEVKGTTNYVTLKIDESLLVSDASSTDITQSLYDQMIAYVDNYTSTMTAAITTLSNNIGTLGNLTTDAKSTVVAAINEVDSHADTANTNIGTMGNLTTDAQDTLVNAINEVDEHADTANTNIGTISSLTTDAKTNLVSAINEVDNHADTANTSIGTLASLKTTAKTNLVSAINENFDTIDAMGNIVGLSYTVVSTW